MLRSKRNLILGLAAVPFLAIVAGYAVFAGKSTKQFAFVDSDSNPTLTLSYGGGLSGGVTTLGVYASGTAELETVWGGHVLQSAEMELSNEEMQEMLSLIAFGGIVDYDELRIREQMIKLQENPRDLPGAPLDTPTFVVEFWIEKTELLSSTPVAIHKRVVIQAPEIMSTRFPSIRALSSLARLQEKFLEIRKAKGGER